MSIDVFLICKRELAVDTFTAHDLDLWSGLSIFATDLLNPGLFLLIATLFNLNPLEFVLGVLLCRSLFLFIILGF